MDIMPCAIAVVAFIVFLTFVSKALFYFSFFLLTAFHELHPVTSAVSFAEKYVVPYFPRSEHS